jgi:hypothetical protein
MARFGSYLQGATGSVWTLATVLFIYVAFLGQRVQLLLQQEEIDTAKLDMADQQHRLDEQAAMTRKQLFESSFFQLLHSHERIVEGIAIGKKDDELAGRDCFTKWYSWLKVTIWPRVRKADNVNDSASIEAAFSQLYDHARTDLGHYFRSLYNLIKFVDEANIENKRFYTNLVRAQMSDQETLVLFYNCLSEQGEKFRVLVEKYSLLKHLGPSDLFELSHKELYSSSAFGRLALQISSDR